MMATEQVLTKDIDYSKVNMRFESEPPESEEMSILIRSVRKDGIVEPLIIRPKGSNRYEVVAGNRRLSAAKAAGLESVPAVIKDLSDERARRIAFVENAIRKEVNVIAKAKGIRALYRDIGLTDQNMIQLTKYIYNEELDDNKGHLKKDVSVTKFATFISNPEFVETYLSIAINSNQQYQILQTIIQIPESTQEILETAPKLSTNKAVLLTHTELRKYPDIVRDAIAQIIIDPDVTIAQARTIVSQWIDDLKTGRKYVTDDGNINMGGDEGKATTEDEETSVAVRERQNRAPASELIDIGTVILTTIGKILHLKRAKGSFGFEPHLYLPALEELHKRMKKGRKQDKIYVAEQAAILQRICKIIADSAR